MEEEPGTSVCPVSSKNGDFGPILKFCGKGFAVLDCGPWMGPVAIISTTSA